MSQEYQFIEGVEQWKEISGFPGYEISDHGRVRSYRSQRKDRRRLNEPHYNDLGRLRPNRRYFTIGLRTDDGKKHIKIVHVLVLEAFIRGRPNGLFALHGPLGRKVNTVGNLSWGTREKNLIDDKIRDGTFFQPAKITIDQVQAIRLALRTGEAMPLISDRMHIPLEIIKKINRGERWKWLSIPFELSAFPIFVHSKARKRTPSKPRPDLVLCRMRRLAACLLIAS